MIDKTNPPDNVEVFHHDQSECDDINAINGVSAEDADTSEASFYTPGWYYWFCFPGCIPESLASGPFDTSEAAVEDAWEQAGD